MTKDYKNSGGKITSNPKPGSLLPFMTGLVAGLLIAVIVYLQEHWPVTGIEPATDHGTTVAAADKTMGPAKAAESKPIETKPLPEPEFTFYTILPNKEVNFSEWVTKENEHPAEAAESPQQQAMYILQVGSFEGYDAADEVKAKLALLGISADIQRVVINGQDIRHRVRIGPYKDTNKLNDVRERLLANNLDFVLLKLQMDDISETTALAPPPAAE